MRYALLVIGLVLEALPATGQLTRTWSANDRVTYYITQNGITVLWAGLNNESTNGTNDFHHGILFTNVFRGTRNGNTISGDWADVRGRDNSTAAGTLTLRVNPDGTLRKTGSTASPFRATEWRRVSLPNDPDMRARFDQVMRNDGGTMHDHLKMYKDFAVIIGTVI